MHQCFKLGKVNGSDFRFWFFPQVFFNSEFRLQKIFENSFVKRHTRDFLVLCSELACNLWHERTSTFFYYSNLSIKVKNSESLIWLRLSIRDKISFVVGRSGKVVALLLFRNLFIGFRLYVAAAGYNCYDMLAFLFWYDIVIKFPAL